MHDVYFQNIQGLCFLLVPIRPLYLDGAGSKSSLNSDTFHFYIFTFKELLHSKMSVTIVFCVSCYPTWRVLVQMGRTGLSKSRLREIVNFSAERETVNFSARLFRIGLRYGLYFISFNNNRLWINNRGMGLIWDGGYPDGLSWHGMTQRYQPREEGFTPW